MWTRKLLKTHGKEYFYRNYWRTVLAALAYTICISGGSMVSARIHPERLIFSAKNLNSNYFDFHLNGSSEVFAMLDLMKQFILGFIAILAVLSIISYLISLAISAFLITPLEVGCRRFFLDNHNEPASVKSLAFSFEGKKYLNIVATCFSTMLFRSLWFLLFIIPGIIKVYSYRLVPYILADDPEMKPDEVITLSRKLMDGNKWNAFLLDLSFIFWNLLNYLTLGILGLFWLNPYKRCTDAELYLVLRYGIAEPRPDASSVSISSADATAAVGATSENKTADSDTSENKATADSDTSEKPAEDTGNDAPSSDPIETDETETIEKTE